MVSTMVGAFAAGFLLDYGWTVYTRAVLDGRHIMAALSSMAIGGLSAAGLLSVVNNPWTLVPYIAGLGLGTYVAVSRAK